MAAILSWPGIQRKSCSLRSKPTLLHAEIWAKALLLLEMFSSSSQRSPGIRCSPALLLWLFYFSLQLCKCSAVEQSRAHIWVSFLPGTTFGWDKAPSGLSLVTKASEAIYTELHHPERTGFSHIPQNVLDEQQLPWSRGVGAPFSWAREAWNHYCLIWHKFIKNCYDPKLHFLNNKKEKSSVSKCCSPLLSINHAHWKCHFLWQPIHVIFTCTHRRAAGESLWVYQLKECGDQGMWWSRQ